MMGERTSVHPDPARLAAFARGIADVEQMAELETHLAVCESCRVVLSTFSDDEFAGSLRRSQEDSGLATNARGAGNLSATEQVALDATGFEVPSSFGPGDAKSVSDPVWSVGQSDLSGFRTRALPLEQELPLELLNHSRYGIVRKLGTGGMGSVYLAQHRVMDRPVALKVIRRDLLGNAALVERFRREVKAAALLALHPNIVAAYDAEQAGDSHFLVMEFVDGVDLGDLVRSGGPLTCEAACEAIKQAAEGLEHAHQRGMVHRDIKPQNLMRTPGGQVKILDFGLARFASEILPDLVHSGALETEPTAAATVSPGGVQLTLTDMLLGSADYIAPEQASTPRSTDIRADIYSLGCTLYYLLTGHPPFPGGSLMEKLKAHSEVAPRPMTELRPNVPAGLTLLIDRMMNKDRSLRFQRPADVVQALAPFCGSDKSVVVTGASLPVSETAEPPHDQAVTYEDLALLDPSFNIPAKTRRRQKQAAALLSCVGALLFLAWNYPEFRYPLGGLLAVIGVVLCTLGAMSQAPLAWRQGLLKSMAYRFFSLDQLAYVQTRRAEAWDYFAFFASGLMIVAISVAIVTTAPRARMAEQSERAYQRAVNEYVRGSGFKSPPPVTDDPKNFF
jgi:serine/threonine protein kinase